MKKIVKNIIKIVVFCIIFVTISHSLLTVFNTKEMRMLDRFYKTKEGAIDVLFSGNSHAHCNIDQRILWENYGIAGYTLSCGNQMLDSSYYYIREAVTRKHPKVVVLELYGVTFENVKNTEASIYNNSLPMIWSRNFFEYIECLADDVQMDATWEEQIILKDPIVHSRYKELSRSDFVDGIPFLKGYRGSYEHEEHEKNDNAKTDEMMDLIPRTEEMLLKIIQFTKENNVQLVLIKTPYCVDRESQMRLNRVGEIAKENDILFLDYNKLYDEIDFDFSTDMRDTGHLNNYGAEKVTKHLGQYLKDHCDITDRRGEVGYESWDKNAYYLDNKDICHTLHQAGNINEYLQILNENKKNQTIILALTGNYNAQGSIYLSDILSLGITEEEYLQGGCFIIHDGQITNRYLGKDYNDCIPVSGGEIHVESQHCGDEETSNIIIGNEEQRLVDNGVNIVVYNEELKQLIDVAAVDIFAGTEMQYKELDED